MPELSVDTAPFRAYSKARREFLEAIGCPGSCRDPLGEFAERLVRDQLKGVLAPSRTQQAHDVIAPDGRRVQVKCLSNPLDGWRNDHVVEAGDSRDDYAVVAFNGLTLRAIVVFRLADLPKVYLELGKRHGKKDTTLHLGTGAPAKIISDPARFEPFGVTCFLPPPS
jgi:hypothetical protein